MTNPRHRVVVAGLSLVSGPVGLFVALIGLRLCGQGAIGLSTITGVPRLYPYHRAKALAGRGGDGGGEVSWLGLQWLERGCLAGLVVRASSQSSWAAG